MAFGFRAAWTRRMLAALYERRVLLEQRFVARLFQSPGKRSAVVRADQRDPYRMEAVDHPPAGRQNSSPGTPSPLLSDGSLCARNGHNRTPLMSGYRLGLCLITLGWSVPELARRTGEHRNTIRRWVDGSQAIPDDIGARIARLAAAIAADPFPRRKCLRRAPDLVVLTLGQSEESEGRADASPSTRS